VRPSAAELLVCNPPELATAIFCNFLQFRMPRRTWAWGPPAELQVVCFPARETYAAGPTRRLPPQSAHFCSRGQQRFAPRWKSVWEPGFHREFTMGVNTGVSSEDQGPSKHRGFIGR
jgi:hypothetical protein